MIFYLKDNNKKIRQKIINAGIDVCVCASFENACWLDYSERVGSVHGVGYWDNSMNINSQQEALELFLDENKAYLIECKNVNDFINKIKFYNK